MYKHITSKQRYTIYVLLQKEMSKKDIAKAMDDEKAMIYAALMVSIYSPQIWDGFE